MSILRIIKIVLGILPFAFLCLLTSKINLKKENRGCQILMPLVSIVYSIIIISFLEKVEALIYKLVSWIQSFIPFLSNIDMNPWLIYIFNALFVLGFVVCKSALLPIFKGIWSNKKIMEVTSGWFYEYSEDLDKWFLKKELANFRAFYKGFYYASLIAASLVFVLSRIYTKSIFFKATFYPACGVIILGEIVFFFGGMIKEEFLEDVLGDSEESFGVANYSKLRDILKKNFKNHVVFDNAENNLDNISETFDVLDSMSNSDDELQKILGDYFRSLKENGSDIDINYVKSCVYLLKSKSVLFGNPFYKDLTDYIMLPISHSLIGYKKCLVISGNDSTNEDVKSWITNGICGFSGTDSLWKCEFLSEQGGDIDVGVLKFCDLYNLKIQRANKDFLRDVGFVIIVEPSKIISSGQIGLNLLVNQFESKDITYCIFDRNCNGLIDSLSHILKTSITDVTATLKSGTTASQMFWKADGPYMHHHILPNISHYLGIGTEINTVAIKHQIPVTEWIGCEKFPVVDMKWIAGQYYNQICDYANLPLSQDAFNRSFKINSNLWDYKKSENIFFVVEDEFQNIFEVSRLFSSRAKNQSFVNIISENYMLRDYMIDNARVFSADPKAIPTVVPDYVRTERNVTLKLIMMMIDEPVSESFIGKEFLLSGISFEDPYEKLQELILKYCDVDDPSLTIRFKEKMSEDGLNSLIVKAYEINNSNELYDYVSSLRNAYYLLEDEEDQKHNIGAKLYGHVYQMGLPGQFTSINGKYYEIQTITVNNGVVVRRAADHIYARHYYHQLRQIEVSDWVLSEEMGKNKKVSEFELLTGSATIKIDTSGYYDMTEYGNYKTAKKILIDNIPQRIYKNKSILKISFPNSNDKILYTICVLLNELFRTTYPNSYQYVCATIVHENTETDLLYSLSGDCEQGAIYIIEDSEIDLGLLSSVERNIVEYLEIVTDYLLWHNKKMLEPPEEEEEETDEVFEPDFAEPGEKKGIFTKIKEFFKKIFKRKPKNGEDVQETPSNNIEPTEDDSTENETVLDGNEGEHNQAEIEKAEGKKGFWKRIKERKKKKEKPEISEEIDNDSKDRTEELTEGDKEEANEEYPIDSVGEEFNDDNQSEDTNEESEDNSLPILHSKFVPFLKDDIDGTDIGGDDEELAEDSTQKTDYQEHCFLKFGYEEFIESLAIQETVDYLTEYGFDDSPLHNVREFELTEEEYEHIKDPSKYGVHLCDFCGAELVGGEYDVLKDGRERCKHCSLTAIKTGEDFKALYKNVIRNMETFYGIKINTPIRVRMTDAKKIAKHVGETFVATPGMDARTLGFAQKDSSGYSIYIENGSPKLAAIATLAHELTHIWQYLNWNEKELVEKYGKDHLLEVYEGMAKWAEIQYLILLNEIPYAKRQEIITRLRDDVYGHGFINYDKKYPLSYGTQVNKTPFKNKFPL